MLLLALPAIPLALRANRTTQGEPIDQTLEALVSFPLLLPKNLAADRARSVVRIACGISGRVGGLNTCLTRSLVLATILKHQPNVLLNVGFRTPRNNSEMAEGHAWVTLAGDNISDDIPEHIRDHDNHVIAHSFSISQCPHNQTSSQR